MTALAASDITGWRQRLPTVDMAAVMAGGVEEPQRLCGRYYSGGLHALMGEPESGKTTLLAHDAAQVLAGHGAVVWLDEDSGHEPLAEQLIAVGASVDDVRHGLTYVEFPGLRWSDADIAMLRTLLDDIEPSLVVFDSSAGFLAAAGLAENDNDATGGFYKNVLLRAARHSKAAVVVIDHVTKNGDGGRYARGAGSKLAIVDVAYSIERVRAFSRQESGALRLVVRKDRRGYLHRQHDIAVHVADGRIRLDVEPSLPTASDDVGPAARKLLDALVASDLPLTNAALVDAVEAKHGHGLRRETVSRELNKLLLLGLVDCLDDGNRGAKRWLPATPQGGVTTCDDL